MIKSLEEHLLAQTKVHIRTVHDSSAAVGWAGHHALIIDRSEQAGGMGLGYNGGELLLLAIGGCYCNDIFREADKRKIKVRSVQVNVEADWGGDPVRAQNVIFSVRVEAEAGESEIQELITHTDRIAEIPNSLRLGTPVTLTQIEVVSAQK
jgi:uncharacterized OsmC-like protein